MAGRLLEYPTSLAKMLKNKNAQSNTLQLFSSDPEYFFDCKRELVDNSVMITPKEF